tara:strand:+ start:1088 stop:2050 length:963 start_codon:yes stop_codon:yes gene_type:complete
MSDQFKFLDKAYDYSSSAQQDDAAQSFLDKKLAKNKFTIAQEDTNSKFDPSRYTAGQLSELNDNGGPKKSGQQQLAVTNQNEIDKFEPGPNQGGVGTLEERYQKKFGSSAGDDLKGANNAASANKVYEQIKSLESADYWGQQDLDSLMSKAGHADTQVNIGNYIKDGGLAVDASIQDGIDFSNIQGQLDEKGWNSEKNNSISQLGSALLASGGTGGKAAPVAPKPVEEMVDIEYSPEIKQAKERVQTYENDILSGKTSEDIYKFDGNQGADGIASPMKGAAGIGTPNSGGSQEQASKATASFLDNKKEDVKNKYQFQAQT